MYRVSGLRESGQGIKISATAMNPVLLLVSENLVSVFSGIRNQFSEKMFPGKQEPYERDLYILKTYLRLS